MYIVERKERLRQRVRLTINATEAKTYVSHSDLRLVLELSNAPRTFARIGRLINDLTKRLVDARIVTVLMYLK